MTTSQSRGISQFLAQVRQRLQRYDAMEGLVFGAVAGVLILLPVQFFVRVPLWLTLFAVLLPALSSLANVLRNARSIDNASLEAERAFPSLHNLVRTAWELDSGAISTVDSMHTRTVAQAERSIAGIEPSGVRPMRRVTLFAIISTATLALLAALETTSGDQLRSSVADTLVRARGTADARVVIRVEPPEYMGLETVEYVDPERISVAQGSRVVISTASSGKVRVIHDVDTLAAASREEGSTSGGKQQANTVVTHDGFFVISILGDSGNEESRRLIGITTIPDALPTARITAPGRDLFLTDSTARISVEIEALDDHELASLELRYTRVTGSGEQFTFTDGTIPVAVTREGSRHWKARGTMDLAAFSLTRGDVMVYRAAVRDRRPGATLVESDAFIVEIVGAGSEAAGGFALDPEQDRYAVSQQMVVLKTERLIAERKELDSAMLRDRAREISIEQQRVRAEFVFMMGGELAEEITEDNSMGDLDEAHEAELETDLSAGRMANQGRSALLAAIRSMSRAVMALNVAGVDEALVHEKNAVTELEKAFARTRYLLRVFTEREQLDLSRRLTGNLTDAASSRSPLPVHSADAKRTAQLAVLKILLEGADSSAAVGLATASSSLLASDPSSAEIQDLAARLMRASSAAPGSRQRKILSDSIIQALNARLSKTSSAAPAEVTVAPSGIAERIREGVLRDAERAASGSRSR